MFALDGGALTVSLALAAAGDGLVATSARPSGATLVRRRPSASPSPPAWRGSRASSASCCLVPRLQLAALRLRRAGAGLCRGGRRMRRARRGCPGARRRRAEAAFLRAAVLRDPSRDQRRRSFRARLGPRRTGLMTVSAFGFALVLTRLDAARANPVFRWASLGRARSAAPSRRLALPLEPVPRRRPRRRRDASSTPCCWPTAARGACRRPRFAPRRVPPPGTGAGPGLAASLAAAYRFLQLRVLFHGA